MHGEFRLAIDRQQHLCPASCTCSQAAPTSSPSSNSLCTPPADIRSYLAAVYPVAAKRMGMMDHQDISMFFDSLHFYYDYGCGNHFHNCGEPGGALLRSLYVGLLPSCNPQQKAVTRHPTLGGCVHAHHGFSPEWARSVMSRGYAEVEHRAVGFGAVRTSTQNAGLFRKETGEPAMQARSWILASRPCGILIAAAAEFLSAWTCTHCPWKTSMVAKLLFEVSKQQSFQLHGQPSLHAVASSPQVRPAKERSPIPNAFNLLPMGALRALNDMCSLADVVTCCTTRGMMQWCG